LHPTWTTAKAVLFLDEEPSIYPVEVIYCGIEVKTSLDAEGIKQAVDNIASLINLKFVREQITYTQGNSLKFSQTTGPLGMIFAFDTPFKSAETLLKHFSTSLRDIPSKAWPELVCIINRGILGIGKDQKPVFQLYGLLGKDNTGQIGETLLNKSQEEVTIQDQQYPVMKMNQEYYVVDVARTYTAFLNYLYERLLSKVIMASSNLLRHYIPEQMSRYVVISCQDKEGNSNFNNKKGR